MVSHWFYTTEFKGDTISEKDWPQYEHRAAAQLHRYMNIYTATNADPVAYDMAICEMAEALHSFDLIANGEGGPVSSASIGSVSVSYGHSGGGAVDLSPKEQSKELYSCANRYLNFYRGVC